MITDAKHPLLTPAWSTYVTWKLRRQFRGLWVQGQLPANEPVLLYSNHLNFWDGFIAHQVITRAGRDGYVMMEEAQLARHRFLRRLGAFGVRRGSISAARASLQHAQALLQRPGATVLVFPQGRFEPFDAPIDHFERGVELLAERTGVRCVPMAIRYAVFEHEFPDALVQVGEPHAPESSHAMATRLERLRQSLSRVSSPDALPLLFAGRRSVAEPSLPMKPAPQVPARRLA